MAVDIKRAIGKRIRDLMKEKGLTQKQFAEHLNLTRACIANWEIGAREPDMSLWESLADFFDISIDYLCCRTDKRNYIDPVSSSPSRDVLDLSDLDDDEKEAIRTLYLQMKNSKKA